MSTFIIRVKIDVAELPGDHKLERAMENENFMLVKDTAGLHEKVFAYYGNQGLLDVNNAVKRAALACGKRFCFTVIKDKFAEKQHHKAPAHRE